MALKGHCDVTSGLIKMLWKSYYTKLMAVSVSFPMTQFLVVVVTRLPKKVVTTPVNLEMKPPYTSNWCHYIVARALHTCHLLHLTFFHSPIFHQNDHRHLRLPIWFRSLLFCFLTMEKFLRRS